MIHTTVFIVGGGPAGAACAWRLRQNGVDCLLADQAVFPRLKLCAGWITPQVLKDLHVTPENSPFGLTTFSSFKLSLKGIKFTLPVHQYAIRRWQFDDWLLKRSGVNVVQHQVKHIITEKKGYLIDNSYSAKFLVGAGGTHCPVYQTIFKAHNQRPADSLIVALEEEFRYPVIDDRCHLWFFENKLPGYSWYVPKQGCYVNVGIGANISKLKANRDNIQNQWAHLVNNLQNQELIQDHEFKPRGYAYYLRQKNVKTRIGNAFLVGDALGLATLDMGEGISPAIQSGLLAADAILQDRDYSIQSIQKYSLPALLRIQH